MYKFKIREPFPCSVGKTYEITTTDFDSLAKYIPNVTKIVTEETEQLEDGRTRYMLWFNGEGAIPAIARPVIKPSMLRWREEMICNPDDMTIEWRVITEHFTDHVKCGGKTYNRETEKGSEVVVDGEFEITLKHLPGFPDGLVRKAARACEPFIGRLIQPNLKKFYRAVKRRLKDEEKK